MAKMKPQPPEMNAVRNGALAALIAYTIWGFFPIYFKILGPVLPTEVLAHRILWSVPFGALIIMGRKQWPEVIRVFKSLRLLGILTFGAIMLSVNWGLYIWAVIEGQILQASLGYYIIPLIYVLVGRVFLGERLNRLQWIAVSLAGIGVLYLTVLGGSFPWIAMILACSFTIYSVIRKQVYVGAMPGLFVETLVLFPIAGIYVLWLAQAGLLAFSSQAPSLMGLLIAAGPITVLPLLCFAIGARRLPLSTIGFFQFLAPTLQFMCGLYYGEPLTPERLICFGFIWSAVAVFCYGAWRSSRKVRPISQA